MISTNFFPNDPVPPVTRIDCSDQFIPSASSRFCLNSPRVDQDAIGLLVLTATVRHASKRTATGWILRLPASIADFLNEIRVP